MHNGIVVERETTVAAYRCLAVGRLWIILLLLAGAVALASGFAAERQKASPPGGSLAAGAAADPAVAAPKASGPAYASAAPQPAAGVKSPPPKEREAPPVSKPAVPPAPKTGVSPASKPAAQPGSEPRSSSPSASPPAAAADAPEEDEYELQRLLIDTIDQVQRNYVRRISRRKLIEAAIRGILSELDPYSNYIPPEEMSRFRESVEHEFGGIGIQVTMRDGQLIVTTPLVGTPAYRAGIIAGDRIVEIDGQSTAGMTLDQAIARLKGKEGTPVTLTVVHPARPGRRTVTLVRQVIHVPTVLGHHRKSDHSWEFFLDAPSRIAYVQVTVFSRDTAEELRKVLQSLVQEGMKALILDLRFNPGGLLSSAVEVSDLFVAEGRIVSTAGRNVAERVWNAHKEGTFTGFPMVVLVNRYTASASEIVAACLQDHKRAIIVGERTWGKGSVQNVIPLEERSDGGGKPGSTARALSALKLTTAGYRRPSGKNIDRAPGAKETDDWGVRPDPGFEVRLSDREMLSLVAAQQARQRVPPPSGESGGEKDGRLTGGTPNKSPLSAEAPTEDGEFADRQLEKAMEYLRAELGRRR